MVAYDDFDWIRRDLLDISPTLTEAAGAIVDVMSDEFILQSFNLFLIYLTKF